MMDKMFVHFLGQVNKRNGEWETCRTEQMTEPYARGENYKTPSELLQASTIADQELNVPLAGIKSTVARSQ